MSENPAVPVIGRRKLSEIKEALADVSAGSEVCVMIRDKDRHGDFVVFGEVYEPKTSDGLWVGGWRIADAKSQPTAELMAFLDPDNWIEGDDADARIVRHGDIVTCDVAAAGSVKPSTITGTALAGESDDFLTCGSYIIGGVRAELSLIHGRNEEASARPAIEVGEDA